MQGLTSAKQKLHHQEGYLSLEIIALVNNDTVNILVHDFGE